MEIINGRLFNNILSSWTMSVLFVVYTFYYIRNRKVYIYRKIIWGIACFWLIIDGLIYLLFSSTNRFENYSFPLIPELPFFIRLLGIFIVGCLYLLYFQWNLMCIYQIHGKPVPLEKQPILQKGSAILMYLMLAVHFVLYGMFFYDYYGL